MVLTRRVGRKEHAQWPQEGVELGEHHAGLHAHPGSIWRDFEDRVHVSGEVELNAWADRSPVKARADTPGDNREPVLGGVGDHARDILGVSGRDDAKRLDLSETCVGGVKAAAHRVELHVPVDERP